MDSVDNLNLDFDEPLECTFSDSKLAILKLELENVFMLFAEFYE